MRGIGTVAMIMDMMKINISILMGHVRNWLVHHKRTWLPYGAILLCLAGIWFCWDEGSSGRQEIIREKKSDVGRSSSPVFSAPNDQEQGKTKKGKLVHSTAKAVRYGPLPNLFADALPKKRVDERAPSAPSPKKEEEKNTVQAQTRPVLQGIMNNGGARLAFLADGKEVRVYVVGDCIGSYRIAYINEQAVGLERNEEVIELTR